MSVSHPPDSPGTIESNRHSSRTLVSRLIPTRDGTPLEPRGMTTRACGHFSIVRRPASLVPAIFLDRDGTLIADVPYNGDPDRVQILPDVPAALRTMRRLGYRIIVVTNQSGIARGIINDADVIRVHERLNDLLAAHDAWIDGYYYCPHHVDGRIPDLSQRCPCRKPGPGMIVRAAADWAIDLHRSWMIGDMLSDYEAGLQAGCQALRLLISNGVSNVDTHFGLFDAARLIESFDEAAVAISSGAPPAIRPE